MSDVEAQTKVPFISLGMMIGDIPVVSFVKTL